jgi:manganese/zinc/iron transport system substrate-binding protein
MNAEKRIPRGSFAWLLVAALSALVGCGPLNDDERKTGPAVVRPFTGNHPIKAVCTTGMVADMVRRIGGQWVAVDQIMGEGVDPHLFKATPDVIARIHHADVIFYSGLHLEGRLNELFENRADEKPTVALTSTIPADRLIGDGGGGHDPHVWFDVAMWSETAEAVRLFLVAFDPPRAAEYDARAEQYRAELAKLDAYCREQIASIPDSSRVLVTAHDAFHYFGRAYGIEVKAIQGVSTETEAGVHEINQLNEFIVQRKIKSVFVETSVNEGNIHALVEGCRARNHAVQIGGKLFSDSMGKTGTLEGTYPGMVRHNVDTIVKALR